MATVTKLVDDIDGTDAEETVAFSLDGVTFEIDLSSANAGKLREALALYVAHARRTGGRLRSGRKTVSHAVRSTSPTPAVPATREENRAAREWGMANGMSVSGRGRIPNAVLLAYRNRDVNSEVINTAEVSLNPKVKGSRTRSTSPRSAGNSGTN